MECLVCMETGSIRLCKDCKYFYCRICAGRLNFKCSICRTDYEDDPGLEFVLNSDAIIIHYFDLNQIEYSGINKFICLCICIGTIGLIGSVSGVIGWFVFIGFICLINPFYIRI